MICQSINTATEQEDIPQNKMKPVEEAMIEHAFSMAKASLEIYFSDGMNEEDYSYAYQSLSHALLYIQRKRGRPEE